MVIGLPAALAIDEARIKRFFDAMVHKLAKNAHKGTMAEANIRDCFSRMEEEVAELKEAIQDGNVIDIMLEAADVANFALIAAVAAVERS